MSDMKAAMQALGGIKAYAKSMMGKRRKNSVDRVEDEMRAERGEESEESEDAAMRKADTIEGAVPGGSASKPDEDPFIYGNSRLPENLDDQHEDDDDVTVVLMAGNRPVKQPKGRMR